MLPTLPPTDNLYKFYAISGLALILFSLTIPVKFHHDVCLRRYDVQRQAAITAAELEYWQSRNEQLALAQQKQVGNMEQLVDMAREVPAEKRTAEQSRILLDFANSIDADKQRGLDLAMSNLEQAKMTDQKINEAKINHEEMQYLSFAMTFLSVAGIVCFIFGVWLSWHGFKLWRERIQCHQDSILAADAKARSRP